MKKYLINIGVIIIISLLTIGVLLGNTSIGQFNTWRNQMVPLWLLIAFICIVLYWGFETLIQNLLVKRMYKRNHLWNSFKVVMTGHFFNAITPFASGGQPMQAITMVKQGVPIGTSASILLLKFIIYQIILTLYSLIVLILQLKFFANNVNGFIYLSIGGFFINTIIVGILIYIAVMKDKTKKIGFFCIKKLHQLKLIKRVNYYRRTIIKQVNLFNRSISEIQHNVALIIRITVLTVLQLTCYFLIPFAVYRALGLGGTHVFVMISAAALIAMISSFIPVPGGSGVAEGSFFVLFQLFFPTTILPVAILCWRIITFYMPLCCGALITVLPNYHNQQLINHKDSLTEA